MIEQKNVPGVYPAALLALGSASAWVSRLSSDLAAHSLNSPCSSYSFIQEPTGLHQQTAICVCDRQSVCFAANSWTVDSKFRFLTSIYNKSLSRNSLSTVFHMSISSCPSEPSTTCDSTEHFWLLTDPPTDKSVWEVSRCCRALVDVLREAAPSCGNGGSWFFGLREHAVKFPPFV